MAQKISACLPRALCPQMGSWQSVLCYSTDLWHRLYFAREESGHGSQLVVQWCHGSTDLAVGHSAQAGSLPRLLAMLQGAAKAPVWGCLGVPDSCHGKCALRRGLMPSGNLAGRCLSWPEYLGTRAPMAHEPPAKLLPPAPDVQHLHPLSPSCAKKVPVRSAWGTL